MARFRKGTTDHDGDGKKGGSLKSGSRFVKGSNDPDNDGRKGGSLPKGDGDMVKVKGATKAEKKVVAAAKKAPRVARDAPKADAAVAPRAARKEALAAEQERLAANKPAAPEQPAKTEAADLQESIGRHPGGMEPPVSPEAAKAALDAQFANADGVGDPRVDEIAAGLQVRGY